MDHAAEDVGTGGYQSKTQSLRDKMKKRRQAIESLLTGEGVASSSGETGGETVGVLEKKRKSEDGKPIEEEKIETPEINYMEYYDDYYPVTKK